MHKNSGVPVFRTAPPTPCELQIAGKDLDVSRAQNRRAFRGSAVAPFLAPLGSGGSVRRLPPPAAVPPPIAHSVYKSQRTKPYRQNVIYFFVPFSEDRPNLPAVYLFDLLLW